MGRHSTVEGKWKVRLTLSFPPCLEALTLHRALCVCAALSETSPSCQPLSAGAPVHLNVSNAVLSDAGCRSACSPKLSWLVAFPHFGANLQPHLVYSEPGNMEHGPQWSIRTMASRWSFVSKPWNQGRTVQRDRFLLRGDIQAVSALPGIWNPSRRARSPQG